MAAAPCALPVAPPAEPFGTTPRQQTKTNEQQFRDL
jgi:hypothetical protein